MFPILLGKLKEKLSRRDIYNKWTIPSNFFATLQLSNSEIYFFSKSKVVKVLVETFGRTR